MSYPLTAAKLFDLECAAGDVADLLDLHGALLPDELKLKLATFESDLLAEIEDQLGFTPLDQGQ